MTLELLVDRRPSHRLLDDFVVVGNFETRDGIEEGFRSILTEDARRNREAEKRSVRVRVRGNVKDKE